MARAVSGPFSANANKFTQLRHIRYLRRLQSDFHEVLPFFHLPSIQEVSTKWCVDPHGSKGLDDGRKRIYYPLPERAAPITKLAFEHTNFKPRIIENIVRVCRTLKFLKISFGLHEIHKKEGKSALALALEILDPRRLGQALGSTRHSLRELTLHVETRIKDLIDTVTWMPAVFLPIGSLKDFQTLRALKIGLLILLGSDVISAPQLSDVLPVSLESLHLLTDDWMFCNYWSSTALIRQLETLAMDKPKLLPRLTSVNITDLMMILRGPCNSDTRRWKEEELSATFQRSGIKLVGL